MNKIKKQWLKQLIKLTVIGQKPGSIKIRINKLSELDDAYKAYEKYIVETIYLLPGIQCITINYKKSSIEIEYDEQKTTSKNVYKGLQIILDLLIQNLEIIQTTTQENIDDVVYKLQQFLQSKI